MKRLKEIRDSVLDAQACTQDVESNVIPLFEGIDVRLGSPIR